MGARKVDQIRVSINFLTRNCRIIFEITPLQDMCRNDMSTVVQHVAILLSVYTVFLHHFMFLFLNLIFFVQYQMNKEVQYQLLILKTVVEIQFVWLCNRN